MAKATFNSPRPLLQKYGTKTKGETHVKANSQTAKPSIVNAWSTKSSVPFFRVGNYAPVFDELTTFDLPVEGAIPPDLNGWYLRNGPNPRHDTPHYFTGDGMVHGVRLESGRAAWYRNRWVPTESFEKPFLLQQRRHAQPARQHGQYERPN